MSSCRFSSLSRDDQVAVIQGLSDAGYGDHQIAWLTEFDVIDVCRILTIRCRDNRT
jgi:hypothetical protein